MSDFSDLCPLFNTAVYNEIMAPSLTLTSISTTTHLFRFPAFGRSVIVTDFYAAKLTTFAATCTALKLKLKRGATVATVAGSKTAFASVTLSATITTQTKGKFIVGTVTDTTFSATQILSIHTSKKEDGALSAHVIVRYKEK